MSAASPAEIGFRRQIARPVAGLGPSAYRPEPAAILKPTRPGALADLDAAVALAVRRYGRAAARDDAAGSTVTNRLRLEALDEPAEARAHRAVALRGGRPWAR